MKGQRLQLCQLLMETSYRLRPLWYSCGRYFGTISGTPSFDVEFDLDGQIQGQRSWWCQLFREASFRLDDFGVDADVISVRYPVPRPLTLNLILKIKCKIKRQACASCSGLLAIV